MAPPFNQGRKGATTTWPRPLGYHVPDNVTVPASAAVSTSALETFFPYLFQKPVRITRLGVYVVTPQTGAECRIGLYSDLDGIPGALVVDAGTIDLAAAGAGIKEAALDVTVPAGLYWSCLQMKNVATQATVMRCGGSLPCGIPTTAAIIATGVIPRYLVRAITYGSALLATAAAVAASGGSDGVVPLVKVS